VTVWFWLAGHSCKGKLKNRKKEKKIPRTILYFCIWIKIPIPVTRSWRDLIICHGCQYGFEQFVGIISIELRKYVFVMKHNIYVYRSCMLA
jgi:hypothetical protein